MVTANAIGRTKQGGKVLSISSGGMVPCRGDRETRRSTDNTMVTLELDGDRSSRVVADLKESWMEINTPFMIVNVARPEIRRP